MRIGSLFSGIGGLELGLERAGCGEVVWQCEAEPFARRVLAKRWPGVPIYEDVRSMGAWLPVPDVDVICGGFPCQDISNAGKGAGLDGSRSGLFFDLARVVRLVRPRYLVLENVSAVLARGGARVLGELAACGYDAVWDCVPAASVGAPHRRDRWFCVAVLGNPLRSGLEGHRGQRGLGSFGGALESRRAGPWSTQPRLGGVVDGLPSGVDRSRVTWPTPTKNDVVNAGYQSSNGRDFPTLPGAAGSAPARAGAEWPRRPVATWEGDTPRTVPPKRVRDRKHRLRALGNAVVPQVAEVVGRVLMEVHRERS